MRVVFRTDASLQIGTGHVMRCLTLASVLSFHGAICIFICRKQPGHLIEYIRRQGYWVEVLPAGSYARCNAGVAVDGLAHKAWLGTTQKQDADACCPILQRLQPDWLIVDHYALDCDWEMALQGKYGRLMVIDDLADRHHDCDLLLDQNLGRVAGDYQGLAPDRCKGLFGAHYAMLRPEFPQLRAYSLARREVPRLQHLLITMGGVDPENITLEVLEALGGSVLLADCRVTIIMGAQAPHLRSVKTRTASLPWATDVRVGVSDMAQYMADSDLCIGAAGSTSWERCCMGLPSILMVLADNQRLSAQALQAAGAAVYLDRADIRSTLPALVSALSAPERLYALSKQARAITDGGGAKRVASAILAHEHTR